MTDKPISTDLDPARWLDDHGDILFRYAVTRLRDAAIAEDMVQETFLAAMKAKDRFSGKSTERTWLVGILKHKIVDYIRKASREQTYGDTEIPEADSDYFDRKGHWRVKPPEWQTNPQKAFEQEEFYVVLQSCLDALPERLRIIFTLREIEGQSAEEICKTMDITSTNLWVLLYRARMRLKTCLEKNWFDKNNA